MMTLKWIDLHCPVCESVFESMAASARIAEWRGDDTRRVAELWVRAAWCCVDEDDVEAERYYACHAARWLAKALDSFGEFDENEQTTMAYRLGELWLRIGDTRQANAWFERAGRSS